MQLFEPDILTSFELAFLDFANERLNEELPYEPYNVAYTNFQDLLQKIVSVMPDNTFPIDQEGLLQKIQQNQILGLTNLTAQILSSNNLIKLSIANPRQLDDYVLGGFTNTGVNYFLVNPFDDSQVSGNQNNILLYLGRDMDGYYNKFFPINNIELSEDNIKEFRPLIYIYAGYRTSGQPPTNLDFVNYLKSNIVNAAPTQSGVSNSATRLNNFLDRLITKMQGDKDFNIQQTANKGTIKTGYQEDPLKLEQYNYFKSFNDRWVAGNFRPKNINGRIFIS